MPNIKQETGRGFSSNGVNISTISNTAAEMVLFQQMIPAGALGTLKRIDYYLNALITTGLVNPSITIRVRLGTSVLAVMNSASLLVSQSNKPFVIEGRIKNTSANTQEVYAKVTKNQTGLLGSNDMEAASWAVDTTIDQMFQITAQFGTALTSTTLTVKDADMECS